MASETVTQRWLRQNVQTYPDHQRVYADADALLSRYPTIRPKTDVYTYDDGRTQLLLCLHGLLPINFRGATYNIPVAIWVTRDYPREPPISYVVPTSEILVRPGPYVDVSGRCDIGYIHDWARKSEGCSLSSLAEALQQQFSREPPVYARPKQQPVAQPPPRPQSAVTGPDYATRPPPPPPLASSSPGIVQPDGARPVLPPKPDSSLTPLLPTTATLAATSPHPTSTPSPFSTSNYAQKPPPPPPAQGTPGSAQHQPFNAPPFGNDRSGPPTTSLPGFASPTRGPPPLPPSVPVSPPPAGSSPLPPHLHSSQWHPTSTSPIPGSRPLSAFGPGSGGAFPPSVLPQANFHKPPPPLPPPTTSPAQALRQVKDRAPSAAPNLLDDDDASAALTQPGPPRPDPQDIAPARPPNPELLALQARVHEKLSGELNSLSQALAIDAERLRAHQSDLLAGEPAIRDERARLEAVRDVCRTVASRLRAAVDQAEAASGELKRKGDPSVDELVCSTSIVHNQLFNLVAEDNAIEDTIYHLHRALNSGRIDLERFLRTTRILAEEQFMKRALIERIRTGLSGGSIDGS